MIAKGKTMENTVDFSIYFQQIRSKIVRILLLALLVGVVAFPLIKIIPSIYVSTATLMFKALQADATPFSQTERYDSTRNDYYETQYSLMNSRVVLISAIKALKLDESPAWNGNIKTPSAQNAGIRLGNALKRLQQGLTISGIRNSQLASVSYESRVADEAAAVANGVAQAFIAYNLQQKQNATAGAQRWNAQQMETVKQQLETQKAQINDFLKKEGLLTFRGVDGFETEELGIVTNRLADATQRRIKAQSEYDAVRQASGRSLENIISLPEFSNHAQIQDLRISLIQTKRKLSELSQRYGPKHPKIQEARAEVAAVNGQLSLVLKELSEGARQQYQSAVEDENRYSAMLEQQKQGFSEIAAKRDRYNTLMTDLKKTEDLYQSLYQKSHEQALSALLADPDVTLYDPAIPAVRPSKPNKAMLLIMVVALVVMLYLAWIVVTTALDNRLRRLSLIATRLGVTGLGEIRDFGNAGDRTQLVRNMLNDPQNMDVIHSIRTRLVLMDNPAQIITLAACEPHEGTSLLATLLAHSFSCDRQTLLIDLDYHSEDSLSTSLSAPDAPGVADILQDKIALDEAIVPVHDQLTFLPRGHLSGSTLLMLTSPAFSQFIASLHKRYRQIIIDTSPLHRTQDSLLVGRMAEGTLLVLRAGQSPAAELRTALDMLRRAQNTVLGAVINRVETKSLETQEGLNTLNQQLGELVTVHKNT